MLTKEMIETAANKLNEKMNHEVRETVDTQLREIIPQMIVDESPNDWMEIVVEEIASQTVELVQENTKVTPMPANVIKTNNKEGFAITMVPLLIVLATYIDAMLICQ